MGEGDKLGVDVGDALVWPELVELAGLGLGLTPGDGLGDGEGLGAKQVAEGVFAVPLLGLSFVFVVTINQAPVPSSFLAPNSLSFNLGKVLTVCSSHNLPAPSP